MNRAICDLTIRGIKGKKKSSLLFAAVVFLSFAFALVTLSVASSMEKTNQESRFDTYGEWYGALLFGKETDCDYLESREWLDTLGTMMCYGKISSASGEAAIGTVDEGLLDIGRITLLDGTLPTAEDEIAMEADLLSELGYDYTVGQEVTLMVEFDSAAEEGFLSGNDVEAEAGSAVEDDLAAADEPIGVEKTYTLTGIIREYADLWSFPEAGTEMILAGAVVTPEAADALWEEAEALAKDNGQKTEGAACHLFFTVREGMEEQMAAEMEAYLTDGNAGGGIFSVNQAAYGDVQDAVYNTAYTVMILAVTLLSVLCLHLISFEGEVRRIALFRSIGITKKQLCTMLFYETAFLSVPAMALGAAAGSVGTWLCLHVALRSVTSSAYVEVPVGKVLATAVLWLVGVFAARLAVYAAALRQPLTGRMYRAHKKIKRNRRMKNRMVVMLSVLFCGTAVFTVLESLYPLSQIRFWGQRPSYLIHAGDAVASVSAGESPQLITSEIFNDLSGIPGVTETIPVATLDAHLQFTGMEDIALVSDLTEMEEEQGNGITCRIFAVPEEYWEDFFSLEETGIDTDAFRAGEEVILAFPADLDGEVNWQGQQYADTGIAADRSVNISLSGYAVDGSEIGRKKEIGNISITVGGTALYADGDIRQSLGEFYDPYTVICSVQCMENILSSLESGYLCGNYMTGEDFGYTGAYVFTNLDAGYLSTDYTMAWVCSGAGLTMSSSREEYAAYIQEYLQTLVLLWSSGGCILLALLLIVGDMVALEAGAEKQTYGILQAIGMSKRQMKKVLYRRFLTFGIIGAVGGWLVYGIYLLAGSDSLSVEAQVYGLRLGGAGASLVVGVTAGCIVVLFVLFFMGKRVLWRTELAEKLRSSV